MSESRKSLAVAQFILNRCKSGGDRAVTPMQLIKLTYIAHGYMLGKFGMPLLDESIQAWKYGPVVPSVYHAVKGYKSAPVPYVPGAPDWTFTNEEMSVMDAVAKNYGTITGISLSAATHQPGTPWHTTWKAEEQNTSISNDLIEYFYSELLQKKEHSSL